MLPGATVPAAREGGKQPAAAAWSAVPLTIIRSTGFPAELLESFRCADTARLSDALLGARARRAAVQCSFARDIFPGAVARERLAGRDRTAFRAWYRLRKEIAAGRAGAAADVAVAAHDAHAARWLPDWEHALAVVASGERALAACYAADLAECRRLLRVAAAEPRLQEAIFLSSPSMHAALHRYLNRDEDCPRDSATRKIEAQLYGYLQRLTMKNESTSFFGPIDYATVQPGQRAWMLLRSQADGRPRRRYTRLTYWAVQALADSIAADPRVAGALVPRLARGCVLTDGAVELPALGRRLPLPEFECSALRLVDGYRTADEIDRLRVDSGDDSASSADVWSRLRRRGLLGRALEVPSAEMNPLTWLRGRIADWPAGSDARAEWLAVLDRFGDLADAFADAPVARKRELLAAAESEFTTITGMDARRGGGELYTDRALLHDEALGDIDCTISPELVARLGIQLRPVLDLCASYSTLVQRACQDRARRLLTELGVGEPVSYLAFMKILLTRISMAACTSDPAVTAFTGQVADLVEDRGRDGIARLTASDLAPLLHPVPAGTFVSPDIFLSAPSIEALATGTYAPVVGEIHYGAQVWTHLLVFREDRDAIGDHIAAMLPGVPGVRAGLVHGRRQGKAFPAELPGYRIEVGGRSVGPPELVLSAADLWVRPAATGVELISRELAQVVHLYPGDPRSPASWLFGTPPVMLPPLRLGTRTPRVVIDDVVAWRSRWELPAAVLDDARRAAPHEAMAVLRDAARRIGAPMRCFVRLPGERKPCYIDLDNVLAVEYLLAMSGTADHVGLVEVLPEPADWWLRGAGGTRSCELRMTWIYGGTDG